jgi:hypothetical protein
MLIYHFDTRDELLRESAMTGPRGRPYLPMFGRLRLR